MNPPYYLDEYKYCPLCSASLNHKKEFIECSKCKHRIFDNPKPCVNLVIENDKEEVLLVTRKIDPFKGWLDFPGGFIQSGETLEEAAKREIKEELGVDLILGRKVGNYLLEYEYDNLTYKLLVFGMTGKITTNKIVVGDDVSGFQFVPRNKVLDAKVCFPEVNKAVLNDYFTTK